PRSLRHKVVVITGASSGIGRDAALRFAARGAYVVLAARRAGALEAVRTEAERAGARTLAVPTDVSSNDQVQRLLGATLEHFGRVDVWVNCAGFGMVAWFTETDEEQFRRVFEVNAMGTYYGCQAALSQMLRQGSGHIINVSSLAGRFALPLNSAYAASKHAVNAIGQSLGRELEGTGIRVSTVMPSLTETGFFAAMESKLPGRGRSVVKAMPVGRVGEAIVRCAVRPRDQVVIAPLGRWLIVLAEVCPPIFRFVARRYLQVRAGDARPWAE
ncbi:MAG: SDR family oxidoreductase, partial [Armatimonadetes bacterium]|nr:SDR family oxidoreductase [Armatimonadota bacterium]